MNDYRTLMAELIGIVVEVDDHLDSEVSPDYQEQPLAQDWARVSKTVEEAGEAIDALIGITGQNPRKGRYGSDDDLYDELCDVSLSGLYALQHFTKDPDATLDIFMARARYHLTRIAALTEASNG